MFRTFVRNNSSAFGLKNAMISLLSRLFIKDRGNYSDPKTRYAYGALCGITGIVLNVFLFAAKLIAGTVSRSISITADAFNNLSDAGSSVLSLIGFKVSSQEPDRQHPFGHGRFEYVSGLLVSVVIVLLGGQLMKTSVLKILRPEEQEFSFFAVGILVLSILVKLYMAFYNSNIGKKIGSPVLKAASSDSLGDCAATLAALVSLLAYGKFGLNIDGWCGAFVAAFILYTGIRSIIETTGFLLGRPPSEETVKQIERIVLSHEGIIGMHDLIVNDYGPGRCIISLHAEVHSDRAFLEIHDMIDDIERDLQKELNCIAVIHMDPVEEDDETTKCYREAVLRIIAEIDPALSVHDFRISRYPSHTDLIFDLVIPFGFRMTDEQVLTRVSREVGRLEGSCSAIITVDKSSAI